MLGSIGRLVGSIEAPFMRLHLRLRTMSGGGNAVDPLPIPPAFWIGMVVLSLGLTLGAYAGLIAFAQSRGARALGQPFVLYLDAAGSTAGVDRDSYAEFKEIYLAQFDEDLRDQPEMDKALRSIYLQQGSGFGRLQVTIAFAQSTFLGATGTLSAEDVIGTFRPGLKVRDLTELQLVREVLRARVVSSAATGTEPTQASAEEGASGADSKEDARIASALASRIVISLIGSMRDHWSRRTLQMFCGWIQGFTVWAAALGLLILLVRGHWARTVREVVRRDGALEARGAVLWALSSDPEAPRDERSSERAIVPIENLVRRLALSRVETPELSTRAGIDAVISQWITRLRDTAYGQVDFLLWLVPTLGFVGTIVGITAAMMQAPSIVQQGDPTMQAARIRLVGSFLGTAFDTTFVALIAAIPMTWLRTATEQSEVDALTTLGDEAERRLPSKFDIVLSHEDAT